MRNRLPFFVTATVLTLSCADSSTAPDYDAAAEGTWTLQTVNGQTLPYRGPGVGGTLDVISSEIKLTEFRRASHWYTSTRYVTGAGTSGPGSTITDVDENLGWGTVRDSVWINVYFPLNTWAYGGRVSGNTLTLTITKAFRLPSGVYVYRR